MNTSLVRVYRKRFGSENLHFTITHSVCEECNDADGLFQPK